MKGKRGILFFTFALITATCPGEKTNTNLRKSKDSGSDFKRGTEQAYCLVLSGSRILSANRKIFLFLRYSYIHKMNVVLGDECTRRARNDHDVSRITHRQRTGIAAKRGKFSFRGSGGRKRAVASKMTERQTPTAQGGSRY